MPTYEIYATVVQEVMTTVEAENEEQAIVKAQERPIDHDDEGKLQKQLRWGSSKDGWTYWGWPELEDLEVVK